jgi:hypothetical protein
MPGRGRGTEVHRQQRRHDWTLDRHDPRPKPIFTSPTGSRPNNDLRLASHHEPPA